MDAQRVEDLMLTVGEKLIEEGRQKGRLEGWAEGRAAGLSEGRAAGLSEGRAQGRAEDVLRILVTRGLHVDDQTRRRILSCTDTATLDRWFDRALNATRLSDVLGNQAQ